MRKSNSKWEFVGLLTFLLGLTLLLTNGFTERIFAQEEHVDVYQKISPIGHVLEEIMKNYVEEPDVDLVVEGALTGMMDSLDKHSSYISPEGFKELTEDTQGEIEGIGVIISYDDDKNIICLQPIPDAPAAKAGMIAGDRFIEVDGVSLEGKTTRDAAQLIKGPRGTEVTIKVLRFPMGKGLSGMPEELTFTIKRGKIPVESILESRVLDGGVGYVRLSDFKKNTDDELRDELKRLSEQGMKSLVLDLRWNPGGLLMSSKAVSDLFLPPDKVVTYTRGRATQRHEDIELSTSRAPVIPEDFPVIILVNGNTASAAEIVTGALQYHARCIVVGEKTYGKGSVQTIIQLMNPPGSALRLTTALYYTPGGITINNEGIRPDVLVEVDEEQSVRLWLQLYQSNSEDPGRKDTVNHGSVTGDEVHEERTNDDGDVEPATIEDVQLKQAVEMLTSGKSWAELIQEYHQDPSVTQVAAKEDADKTADTPQEVSTTN